MLMSICENNDGFTWLDELDRRLNLLPLAHDARAKRQHQNYVDMLRKRLESYTNTRKTRRARRDLNQGKISKGGWKKGKYKPDSVHAGWQPQQKKKKSVSNNRCCSRCGHRGHSTRSCALPKTGGHEQIPLKKLEGAAKIWYM